MPFTIVFIDKKGRSYNDSSRDLNAYIQRHPMIIPRLHQPRFSAKILEIAAHHSGMKVVYRPADSRVRRNLTYVIRKNIFRTDKELWAFINKPENLDTVK
ncbi:MAG: hypothetical protein Q4A84_10150 [Neisseria sp.]|uniref:hypothetical protein n=1 Tax=Neisseria sp. TaxID=192066 RepID=UPI0026DB087A|nr:hypothetical protein [Neisseria sp.]MDO4642038.1 hypothetical protein [Neisseria sp.]